MYYVEIPQGNLLAQEQVDQLVVGMSKEQVQFILGSPTLIDTFHQNQWDYPYQVTPSRGEMTESLFIVYFDEAELLERYEGTLPQVELITPIPQAS